MAQISSMTMGPPPNPAVGLLPAGTVFTITHDHVAAQGAVAIAAAAAAGISSPEFELELGLQ